MLVVHDGTARCAAANAYRGEGWVSEPGPDVSARDRWLPVLDESARALHSKLEGTPVEWLDRKIAMIDTDAQLSGRRILAMMLEHDIHHGSQLETYAGLNGWPVPDIFGLSAEAIGTLQAEQRAKHSR